MLDTRSFCYNNNIKGSVQDMLNIKKININRVSEYIKLSDNIIYTKFQVRIVSQFFLSLTTYDLKFIKI